MLAMDEMLHPDVAQPVAVGISDVMIQGLHRSLGQSLQLMATSMALR